MNVADVKAIRRAMEDASVLPWVRARHGGIVTHGRSARAHDDSEVAYYGGSLVAESIVDPDAHLLSLVMWHLPDLLRLAERSMRSQHEEVPF